VFKVEEVGVEDKRSGDNKALDVETLFEKSLHVLDCVDARTSGLWTFPTTAKISGFLEYQLAV
jgi:hypothetical protein